MAQTVHKLCERGVSLAESRRSSGASGPNRKGCLNVTGGNLPRRGVRAGAKRNTTGHLKSTTEPHSNPGVKGI